jgi:hypothetical protein
MLRKAIKKILIFAGSWGVCTAVTTAVVLAPGTVISTLGLPGTAVLGATLYSGMIPYVLSATI